MDIYIVLRGQVFGPHQRLKGPNGLTLKIIEPDRTGSTGPNRFYRTDKPDKNPGSLCDAGSGTIGPVPYRFNPPLTGANRIGTGPDRPKTAPIIVEEAQPVRLRRKRCKKSNVIHVLEDEAPHIVAEVQSVRLETKRGKKTNELEIHDVGEGAPDIVEEGQFVQRKRCNKSNVLHVLEDEAPHSVGGTIHEAAKEEGKEIQCARNT
ncbi:hypothetical protein H5410_038149 [Solanum commersonii]|uniref:Uncharacterized protein n=1 Tax=Solanum commersonii TaxID=4109 RepID=A0A9J5Y9Y0_SOLCO|nr:hypothetical protein H5410_038149 [Solanum commersonii]